MTIEEIEELRRLLQKASQTVWKKHYNFFHKHQNLVESDCTYKFQEEIDHLEITLHIPSYVDYLKEAK